MLRALQYTKLDQVMLFTQQKFASKCDVTLELYCIEILIDVRIIVL